MFPNDRKWFIPLVLTAGFVFLLCLRQLSDPDLGFHLKYGEYILHHASVPDNDLTTYTAGDHRYVDLHWLFQVVLYGLYRAGGYETISLFVCLAGCSLFLLLFYRQRKESVPVPVSLGWLFVAFVIIDPRVAPRPEMVTFLLMTLLLIILDSYVRNRKNRLYLLPLILLIWCNMHSLFILGIVIMAATMAGQWIQQKKPDKILFLWCGAATVACLLNPYGLRGFLFPFELLSRFSPTNIFHQHILEFTAFFSQPVFLLRDYMFLAMLAGTLIMILFHLDHVALHEIFLTILMGFLGLTSVRNIPLFVLIALPVVARLTHVTLRRYPILKKIAGIPAFLVMTLLPVSLMPRILTNAYYADTNSYAKTGLGLDTRHLPAGAARFLTGHRLGGRILNSLGFGGWLSWTIPQPVFMDGRLEVMQESLYEEVTESWNGKLPALIRKYQPDLIVFNYLKYAPWTLQLRQMNEWRLVYADGLAAVFARRGYSPNVEAIPVSSLPVAGSVSPPARRDRWTKGFYRQPDYAFIDHLHLSVLRAQLTPDSPGEPRRRRAGFCFNLANERFRRGDYGSAFRYYDSAILLNPGYVKAYNNRGILRAGKFHDLPGALNDFRSATRIDPTYADAWAGCGSIRFLMHDTAGAINDWSQARKLGSTRASQLLKRWCLPQ